MDVAKRSVVSAVIVRRSFSLGTPSVDALEITPDRFSLIEKIDQSEPLFWNEMVTGMVVPFSRLMLPSSVPLFMVMERLLQDVFLKSSKEFLLAKVFSSFSSV